MGNNTYWILIIGWIVYLALHSILASGTFKKWGYTLLPERHFRKIYIAFSVIGFMALLLYNGKLGGEPLLEVTSTTKFIAMVPSTVGVIVIRMAFKQYKLSSFLGISNESPSFHAEGILSKVRHPIYLGTILLLIGFALFDPRVPTLISVSCMFLYLPFGIYFEEKKLIKQFGQKYLDYKKEVPAIVPRFKYS